MSNLRIIKDRTASGAMRTVTIVALAFVLVMGWGLYRKSAPILSEIPLWDLLTDSTWQPFKNKFGVEIWSPLPENPQPTTSAIILAPRLTACS